MFNRILVFFSIIFCTISCNTDGVPETDNIPETENVEEEVKEDITEVELFERLDIMEINEKISETEETLSPKGIMEMYYPVGKESEEGNETIITKENSLEHEETEVVLVHDGLMDDSVKGFQYVMVLKQQEEKWKVVSLKRNWKCYEGRGHTFWGIDNCK